MKKPVLIRAYHETDWPRLQAIHDAARRDELSASRLDSAFLPLAETAHSEGLFDSMVFVVEIEGTVQGFAAVADHELTWLYCDPDHYRLGIGRALIRHAIDISGGDLRTEVLVGNEAALALYTAEGFSLLRRVDGRLAGNESFAASALYLEYQSGADR